MRTISRFFFFAGALALVACGGSQGGAADPGGNDVPGGACAADACGPRPDVASHPCPDGVTIAGPSCERDANGRCGWAIRECPPEPQPGGSAGAGQPEGTMCGGIAGVACPEGQYCAYAREARCGAGDQSGVCQPRPDMCAQMFQPVCGCDGRTYGNACEASRAGVSVASDGECAGAGDGAGASAGDGAGAGAGEGGERLCGSRGLAPCGPDELCDWPQSAQCGATDVPGVCRPRPRACTRELRPVCGCDGQTYPTACVANSSGVSVAHDGPC